MRPTGNSKDERKENPRMKGQMTNLHQAIIIGLTFALSAGFLAGALLAMGGDPQLQEIYESLF